MDDSGGKDADKNGRWSQVVVDVTTVMGVRMETVTEREAVAPVSEVVMSVRVMH